MNNLSLSLDAVFAQLYAEQALWSVYRRRPSRVIWVAPGVTSYSFRSTSKVGDLGTRLRGAIRSARFAHTTRRGALPAILPAEVPVYEVLTETIPLAEYSTPFGVIWFGFGPASGALVLQEVSYV